MVYNHADDNKDNIRKFLSEIYGEKQYKSDLANLTDSEILQQAQNLRRGVPMATPVFDGAMKRM